MKKTIITSAVLMITTLTIILSCKKVPDPVPTYQSGSTTSSTGSTTSSTGSTTSSGTGQLVIWNSNNSYGNIAIYHNGAYDGTIGGNCPSNPGCANQSGCAIVLTLSAGVYNFTIQATGYQSAVATATVVGSACNSLWIQ